jgi:glycosyltransferase involved in cell wall biosynthesis
MNKKLKNKYPSVSIIIRTMNDVAYLKRLFRILKQQDYSGKVEYILVDTESKDGTIEYAKKQGARIVNIKQAVFNYPKALNLGYQIAQGEILISLVGHALPFRTDWLRYGVSHFDDAKIAGVYGNVIPHKFSEYPKRTWAERIYYWRGFCSSWLHIVRQVRVPALGILGNTNSAIRKSLWVRHHWNEKWAGGGEDYEWASWALKQGYGIICDYHFAVYHSHGLKLRQMINQNKHWMRAHAPSKFKQTDLNFRNDLKF